MNYKGDFTVDRRLFTIGILAIFNGAICSVIAWVLFNLIALFTNLFFFHRFSFESVSPADNTYGLWVIAIPAIGGLIIGLMARYGSERIRGHGIPEAMEAILIGRSRMQPKVAVLKPLASAISIGSGGPFGAEGPIIMTGGAIGSIVAQTFNLTSAERKTLLVAGAAGGMTATFGTPVAAVLLAVELLLFEWKPRSFIPVALASATAALCRPFLLGNAPLWPVTPHGNPPVSAMLAAVVMGILVGGLAMLVTAAVYKSEDFFARLPIHWMWWPILGGLVVGVGGYFQPRALAVGYDVIGDLLSGRYVPHLLIGLMIVKALIWAFALGSGTSGGVLAPLLIIGGCLGAILSGVLPGGDRALWPLLGMAAMMGGAMRCPLTGVVMCLELTYDIRVVPLLLIGTTFSYAFTVLLLKRSILTEKIARRGHHVSGEYEVDPLERLSVGRVMSSPAIGIPAATPARTVLKDFFLAKRHKHQGYPVLDKNNRLLGVITRTNMIDEWVVGLATDPSGKSVGEDLIIAYDLVDRESVFVYPEDSCRAAALRMAEHGVGRLPIVSRETAQVIGIVTRSDLLKARHVLMEEEAKRERFINFRGSHDPVPAEAVTH